MKLYFHVYLFVRGNSRGKDREICLSMLKEYVATKKKYGKIKKMVTRKLFVSVKKMQETFQKYEKELNLFIFLKNQWRTFAEVLNEFPPLLDKFL